MRQAQNLFISSSEKIKSDHLHAHLFVGIDGRLMIAGKYGVSVATAAAIALLHRPAHRAGGYREGENV